MMLFDAHCDAPSQMLRLRDFGRDNAFAQVDFPKMRRGGVEASFFALYVPARLSAEEGLAYLERLLGSLQGQLAAHADQAAPAMDEESLRKNRRRGLLSLFLGIENGHPLTAGGDFGGLLRRFYSAGVRYVTLVHSADNALADSCTGKGRWGGLSPLGREAVAEMNACGMLIDLAHAAAKTIDDVLACSTRPVAFTHGCCAALYPHPRNLGDAQLTAIADRGGFVGISVYPAFLSRQYQEALQSSGPGAELEAEDAFIAHPEDPARRTAWEAVQRRLLALPRSGVADVAVHIDHAVRVAGIEHVGIGTDFDGIEVAAAGLDDISRLGLVLDALRKRGYGEDALEKIASGNLLRVLRDIQN